MRWQVDDGYAGKSRPHYTEIDGEDWDACEDDAERESLINEYVQQDFEQHISWHLIGEPEAVK